MSKLSPFTLIFSPHLRESKPAVADPILDGPGFDPLVASTLDHRPKSSVDPRARGASLSVGVWDLGARIGLLPPLLDHLNAAQTTFTFYGIETAVPLELVGHPGRAIAWAEEELGRRVTKRERDDLSNNVVGDEFFTRSRTLRRKMKLDYLVGITPSRVAGREGETIYWNYFSSSSQKSILASAADLRDIARKAGRPFAAAVVFVAVAELLQNENPRISFHPETRGCLFDFNEDRATIGLGLRAPHIEESCLSRLRPTHREAARSLVAALADYQEVVP